MWLPFSPPCFPSCWPHHRGFWLPELLHGGLKRNTYGKCMAASRSSCLCFLVVHHDVLHVGHQPIGSAWNLRANHWLRAPGLFFCLQDTVDLQISRKGDPVRESCLLPGTYKYKGSDVLSVGDRT